MIDCQLSKEELAELRAAHREARAAHDVRHAYRINAVILLGQGRTVADVADALLFDPDTVRNYFKRYKNGGVDELLRMSYVGSEAMLNATQLKELDAHLQDRLHDTADAVARYVEQRWGVHYSASGMTAVLHRLGYVPKQAKLEPGKHPPAEVQEEFVEKYEISRKTKQKTMPSASWMQPIPCTILSLAVAGSSAARRTPSRATPGAGGSTSTAPSTSRL